MAQTTGGMSWASAKVEAKVFGGAFADHGGTNTKLEASGFDRITGKAHTQVGNTPIVTAGKLEEGEIKLSLIYTEQTGEAWKVLYDAYLAGTKVQFQWTPTGLATAVYQFTSEMGYLKNVTPPQGEASNGDPIMAEATLVCGSYARATLA